MKNVYSMYDSKSESYLKSFTADADGEAKRIFTELANDERTFIGKYPADHTLFKIGTWDPRTGKYTSDLAFENLGNGLMYVKANAPLPQGDQLTLPTAINN